MTGRQSSGDSGGKLLKVIGVEAVVSCPSGRLQNAQEARLA